MSTSKISPKRQAVLKAKTAAVSADAKTLAESRAARVEINSKLVRVNGKPVAEVVAAAPAAPAAPAEPVKLTSAERVAKIQADAEQAAAAKVKPAPAAVVEAVKAVEAAKLSAPLEAAIKRAIVTPQLPPPLPAAAYVKAPNGAAPIVGDKSVIAVKEAAVEELAKAETLSIPLHFLRAALLTAASGNKETRYYLKGVHIHQTANGQTRVVSTDGHRLFAVNLEEVAPVAWAAVGVTLPGDALTRIIRYFGKDAESIEFSFGLKHPSVEVKAPADSAVFKLVPIDGQYPDYQRVIDSAASVFTSERREMQTSTIDSDYFKSAGVLAGALGSKGLMPFVGGDDSSPVVFTFVGVPNALLYIMPMRSESECLPAPAARIYSKGATDDVIAKLLEQVKISRANAKKCKHKKFADVATARADRLQARVDELRAATAVKLAAPQAAETPKVSGAVVAASIATAKAVSSASVH